MENKYGTFYSNNGKYDVLNVNMINRVFSKTIKNLRQKSIEEIYTMSFKGHSFNVLPFLLNGSAYYPDYFRSDLCSFISKSNIQLKRVKISDFDNVEMLDNTLMKCFQASYLDFGVRDMCAYLHKHNPYDLAYILFKSMCENLREIVIDNSYGHYDFKFNSICNTQAFTYYIGVLWMFHLAPELRQMVSRQLKQVKFMDMLESLCPEESFHFKYISGEITSSQLLKEYNAKRYEDGSSIRQRETVSLATNGKYDGRPLTSEEIGMSNDIYCLCTENREYLLNMHLSYCMFFDGTYEELSNRVESKIIECDKAIDDKNEALDRLRKARTTVSELKKVVSEKEKEISELRSNLNKVKTEDELLSRIAELEQLLDEKTSENMKLFNERCELKQVISSQKKKLRLLDSSSGEVEECDNEICDNSTSSDLESIEDIIDKLKGLSYITVGAENVKSLDIKFEEYGFTNVKRFTKSMRNLGDCDCVIVFIRLCHHDEVYLVESKLRGTNTKIVYSSNQNMDMLLRNIYDEVYNTND